jgi:hypothetical protein
LSFAAPFFGWTHISSKELDGDFLYQAPSTSVENYGQYGSKIWEVRIKNLGITGQKISAELVKNMGRKVKNMDNTGKKYRQ